MNRNGRVREGSWRKGGDGRGKEGAGGGYVKNVGKGEEDGNGNGNRNGNGDGDEEKKGEGTGREREGKGKRTGTSDWREVKKEIYTTYCKMSPSGSNIQNLTTSL
jgi:hypothetical protein